LVVVICFVGRGPILRSVARFLVVPDRPAAADYVLVNDGDNRFDAAAQAYHAGLGRRILVIERRPGRLERLGILPTAGALARRELTARGVPEEAVTVLRTERGSTWDRARTLRAWLEGQPPIHLLVLCDRLGSRSLRHVFQNALPHEAFSRVGWRPLAREKYDETNWWRQKEGVHELFLAYLGYAAIVFRGEDRAEWIEWDPDEYENQLGRAS
jgi:hypothetical protein